MQNEIRITEDEVTGEDLLEGRLVEEQEEHRGLLEGER